MVTNLSKTKAYLHLLTPSAAGWVVYGFVSALIIVLNQVPFIQHYLGFPADIEFMRIFTLWLDQALTSLIGEARTNAVVVGSFWAVVGLVVYVFLQALSRLINEIGEGIVEKRGYVWPKGASRLAPLKQAIERAVFRLVAFGTLMYVLLQPLARLLERAPFKDFVGPNQLLQYAVWFVSLVFILHCCVVLLRLVVLRPRLFE